MSSYQPAYFDESEFVRVGCSMSDVSENLLYKLDTLRERFGKPIVITSAYRSPDLEVARGRSGKSSHCKGLAVDILCNNSADRIQLVYWALRVGFVRIGVGKTFLHLDIDSDKPSCMWLY